MDPKIVTVLVLCGNFAFANAENEYGVRKTIAEPLAFESNENGFAKVICAINFLSNNAKPPPSHGQIDYIYQALAYSKFYIKENITGVVDLAFVESIFLYDTIQASSKGDTELQSKFGEKVKSIIDIRKNLHSKPDYKSKDASKFDESYLKSFTKETLAKFEQKQKPESLIDALSQKIEADSTISSIQKLAKIKIELKGSFVVQYTTYGIYRLCSGSKEICHFSLSYNNTSSLEGRAIDIELHTEKFKSIQPLLLQKYVDSVFFNGNFKNLSKSGATEISKVKSVLEVIDLARRTRRAKRGVESENFNFASILFHSLNIDDNVEDPKFDRSAAKIYLELSRALDATPWIARSLDRSYKRLTAISLSPEATVTSLVNLVHNLSTLSTSNNSKHTKDAKLEYANHAQSLHEIYTTERKSFINVETWITKYELRTAYQDLTSRLKNFILKFIPQKLNNGYHHL